jgi:collagenase-like PrtC family protease
MWNRSSLSYRDDLSYNGGMKQIELLAPAKDLECGMAAIDAGADAIYIGAAKFGARESAGNNLDDIAALTAYAHKYWAKVYVTVNTLLYDNEIPQAVQLITDLYSMGVDALIIQDTGLLECDLPPIPIIASTQMHNNTPERVAFLGKVGIRRAILARELSLDEIKAIRKATDIELECFVHGALCVCYSGQCYLSYAFGRRSGNRGQCAQPCRKLYSLVDDTGKTLIRDQHLLSIRDLNLSDRLKDLVRAGVCSFKIEGRMKDRAYVTNVVAHYRQKLDQVISGLGMQRTSSGTTRLDFVPDVNKTFNRGYSTHFIGGGRQRIGSLETPKMMGEMIGKVVDAGKRTFIVESDIPLHNGDGICFFGRRGELRGSVVNDVRGTAVTPDKMTGIEPGVTIFRNHDHEFLTRLEKSKIERLIGITLTLRDTPDGLALSAVDEDGNTAEFAVACEKALAEKPEQALDNIRKQLAKTGGTEFECTKVEVDLPETYFLPMSTLNALRRGVLEKLVSARIENHPRLTGGPVKNDVPYPVTELSFEGNVLNAKAEEFYRRHGVKKIEPAAESGMSLRGRKVMTTRYCIKHQFGMCPKENKLERAHEPLALIDEEGHRLELNFDCGRCRMEVWLR